MATIMEQRPLIEALDLASCCEGGVGAGSAFDGRGRGGEDGADGLSQRVSRFGEAVRARLHKACRSLACWWAVTTDPEFLSSAGSRRDLWTVVWVFVAVQATLMDARSPEFGVLWLADVIGNIYMVLVSCMPTSNLVPDFLLVVAFVSFTILYRVLSGQATQFEFDTMLVFAFLGVHTCLILVSSILVVVINWAVLGDAVAYYVGMGGVMATMLSGMVEYRCATVFQELRAQQMATEKLLDHASDGFCSIELPAGVIRSCSSKMRQSFAAVEPLEGTRLYDLLHQRDHHLVHGLFDSAVARRELVPVLVTCQTCTEAQEFDCKLIPYAVADDLVNVCMQVQGEKRGRLDQADGPHWRLNREPKIRVITDSPWAALGQLDSVEPCAVPDVDGSTGPDLGVASVGEITSAWALAPACEEGLAAAAEGMAQPRPQHTFSEAAQSSLGYSYPTAAVSGMTARRSVASEVSWPLTTASINAQDRSVSPWKRVSTAELRVQTGEPCRREVGVQTEAGGQDVGVQAGNPGGQEGGSDSGKEVASTRPPLPEGARVRRRRPEEQRHAEGSAALDWPAVGRDEGRASSEEQVVAAARQRVLEALAKLNVRCSAASCFTTPFDTRCTSLLRFLEHWSLPMLSNPCCRLHLALKETEHVAKNMQKNLPCERAWRPLSDQQCPTCGGTNKADAAACHCCEQSITPAPEGEPHEAQSSEAQSSGAQSGGAWSTRARAWVASGAAEESLAGMDCDDGALADTSSLYEDE